MTNDICFTLTNQLTKNTGQVVLVYMMPVAERISSDLFLSAWRVLNPSANGGNQRFYCQSQLQVAVEHEPTLCRSALHDARPNQLFVATTQDNQGPALHLSYSETPPSAKQVAVRNETDPPLPLSVIWYVDGSPIIVQKDVNLDGTATLHYLQEFHFLVALPGPQGLNQFSEELRYVVPAQEAFQSKATSTHQGYRLPPGCRNVNVSWVRPGGLAGSDVLVFDPPSVSLR